MLLYIPIAYEGKQWLDQPDKFLIQELPPANENAEDDKDELAKSSQAEGAAQTTYRTTWAANHFIRHMVNTIEKLFNEFKIHPV